MSSHMTVGELSSFLGIPQWKVRRAVDAAPVEIPRAGRYRLIPRENIAEIVAELNRGRLVESEDRSA